MTLLDRLLGHDAWTTRQMLLVCRAMPNAQLDAQFDMSHGSVRSTFLHILRNMEAWTDVMSGKPIRVKRDDEPDQRSIDGMRSRATSLEKNSAVSADTTRIGVGSAGCARRSGNQPMPIRPAPPTVSAAPARSVAPRRKRHKSLRSLAPRIILLPA